MKKQLFTLAVAALALTASAEKSTITLGNDVMPIDTLFHAYVGPGTTQTQLHLSGTYPLDVFYLTVDKTTPGVTMRSVCPGGRIAGNMRPSNMAKQASDDSHLYFCGTNGDFYYTSGTSTDGKSLVGTPIYSAAVDGEVYKSSGSGYQFFVDAEGLAEICRLSWANGTVTNAAGTQVALKGVNCTAYNNSITLYTERGWTSPCQGDYAGYCAEVPAKLVEGQSFQTSGTFDLEITGTATATGDLRVPEGGCVLMARGNAIAFVNALQVGDVVTVDQVIMTPDGRRVRPTQIVSGNPKNVGGGVNLNSEAERGDANDRHPRTAIGVSADGNKVIMMVVDGRGASKGVTTGMLAELMIRAGAAEAVNLDGGGSSALYTSALGVRNTCSDGAERAVGNAIFAVYEGDVNDRTITRLEFTDYRFDAPEMALYTPQVLAFNAAGVVVDSDFQDYTLSAPATLGEVSADGKTLKVNGSAHGVLTASYAGASEASVPVYITDQKPWLALEAVTLDGNSSYTVSLLTKVFNRLVPVDASSYSWSSSDAAVATVDASGTILAIGGGVCTVSGTRNGHTLSIVVTVEVAPAPLIPVEEDFSKWEVKKTLMASVAATELDNGMTLDYTMSSTVRSPKITINNRKAVPARPDAFQIRVADAIVAPKQISLLFQAANSTQPITATLTEFGADGSANWVVNMADYLDISDPGIYPIEFVTLTIVPGDEASATGQIHMPGIEVLYTHSFGGTDTPVVLPLNSTEAWYTLDGILLPAAPTAPGLYLHATHAGVQKVRL